MLSIQTIKIKDETSVGVARRAVHRFASAADFTETELAELDIVAQEIATNAVRYAADGGELHFTDSFSIESERRGSIELFYWDKGPGIYDLEAAMRDSYSTGGGLGGGFGAIRRLTDEFDIYSTVSPPTGRLTYADARRTTHGTALLCRKRAKSFSTEKHNPKESAATDLARRIGVWSRAIEGEEANGDAWFVRENQAGDQMLLAVVDGLGHGKGANEAACAALEVLEEWSGGEALDEIIHATHDALRSTRGAVLGLMLIDRAREQMHYAGVGNTSARVINAPAPARPVSSNGTLGARLGKVSVWTYAWSPETIVIMTTDGVSFSWDIAAYPGLLTKEAQMIAGVLMRDYGRASDDATILVAR